MAQTYHIGMIASHGGVNGVTTTLIQLIEGLCARGHRITLFHRPNAWIGAQKLPKAVACHSIDMGHALPPKSSLEDMARICAQTGIDVLHSHGSAANTVGGLMRLKHGARLVATAHTRIVNVNLLFAHELIVVHQGAIGFYRWRNLIPRKKMTVISNSIVPRDLKVARKIRTQFRFDLGLSKDAILVGVVGEINARKNQSLAAKMIKSARAQTGLDIHGLFLGHQLADEMSKIDDVLEGDPSFIHRLGHVDNARDAMAEFDILLSSSNSEEGPYCLIEAMEAAVPAVVTDTGNAREAVDHGHSGYIFAVKDEANGTSCLIDLARDTQKRETFGARARAKLDTDFTPDAVLPKVEAVYAKLINRA